MEARLVESMPAGAASRRLLQKMLAMTLIILVGTLKASAFWAYDCKDQSVKVEQYSLLDLELWEYREKVQAIERELYGEIMQIKKEQLVQVTRCTVTQMIKSTYCGFQSHVGKTRYKNFHEPIVIKLVDCTLAAKAGKFKLNGKEYQFDINVLRSVVINLIRGLDNNSK